MISLSTDILSTQLDLESGGPLKTALPDNPEQVSFESVLDSGIQQQKEILAEDITYPGMDMKVELLEDVPNPEADIPSVNIAPKTEAISNSISFGEEITEPVFVIEHGKPSAVTNDLIVPVHTEVDGIRGQFFETEDAAFSKRMLHQERGLANESTNLNFTHAPGMEEIEQFNREFSMSVPLRNETSENLAAGNAHLAKTDLQAELKNLDLKTLSMENGNKEITLKAALAEKLSAANIEDSEGVEPTSNFSFDFASDDLLQNKPIANNAAAVVKDMVLTNPQAMTNNKVTGLSNPIDVSSIEAAKDQVFITQVRRDIEGISGQDFDIKFKVAPENIGRLNVEILRDKSDTHVHLETETENARSIILAAQSKLETEIRQHGTKLARFDVSVDQGSSEHADAQSSNDQNARNAPTHGDAARGDLTPTPYGTSNITSTKTNQARFA